VIIGVLVSPIVTKKLGLKKNLLVMVIVNIVTSVAVFFIPATAEGVIALYVLSSIGYLFIGIARPAQETMLPFAADYGEWKFNTNNGGFLGALNGFTQKLYTTLIGALPAWILVLVGYVPNSEQTATSLVGIKLSMSIFPAILFVILALIVSCWDMTTKRQIEIANEISARQASDS
jgi:Na+/melibiose symporter-like transporter